MARSEEEVIADAHRVFSRMSISMPSSADASKVRDLFGRIRKMRNKVARLAGWLYPRVASAKVELLLVERVIEAKGIAKLANRDGIGLAKNAAERTAMIKDSLSELIDEKAEKKARLVRLEECLAHAKLVQSELKLAFEEGSRTLSTLELEWKIENGAL